MTVTELIEKIQTCDLKETLNRDDVESWAVMQISRALRHFVEGEYMGAAKYFLFACMISEKEAMPPLHYQGADRMIKEFAGRIKSF